MATKQRCPKCNGLNDLDAPRCQHCNAPLLQVCPVCGAARPWYVPKCVYCDARADDSALFAEAFREQPEREPARPLLAARDLRPAPSAPSTVPPTSTSPPHLRHQGALASGALPRRRAGARPRRPCAIPWPAGSGRLPGCARIVDLFAAHDRHYVVSSTWQAGRSARSSLSAALGVARSGPQLGRPVVRHLELPAQPEPAPVRGTSGPGARVVTPEGELRLVGLGLGTLFTPNPAQPMGSFRG
jgi:hypothetical protein